VTVRAFLAGLLIVATLAFAGGALWATGATRCPTKASCRAVYDQAARRWSIQPVEADQPAAEAGR
jgi:hypothetical protein